MREHAGLVMKRCRLRGNRNELPEVGHCKERKFRDKGEGEMDQE